jgi:hypothetical protein
MLTNMAQQQYIHTDIKRSSFEDQFFKADVLFDDHLLVWLISGETRIVQADKTYLFGAGDTLLFPRHLLATVINYPKRWLAAPGGGHAPYADAAKKLLPQKR